MRLHCVGGTVLNCYVSVSVFDHGPGSPPQAMDKLKQPFVPATAARRYASCLGLGLAIDVSTF